jgi:hypothetical protein
MTLNLMAPSIKIKKSETQHNVWLVSFMLSVEVKPVMLSVIVLNVIMQSVMAPFELEPRS